MVKAVARPGPRFERRGREQHGGSLRLRPGHGKDWDWMGLMVMPAMLYKGETSGRRWGIYGPWPRPAHLPIMIYNNPLSYANDVTPAMFAQLADEKNFVALKESSGGRAAGDGLAQYGGGSLRHL